MDMSSKDELMSVYPNQPPPSPGEIISVDIFSLEIPFDPGGGGEFFTLGRWSSFESVLVRITTTDGLEGWGECFAYGCRPAVIEALRDMVAPLLIGQDAEKITELMKEVQHKLHLFGRYGITMFAISGVDIALWDRRAKASGVPLWKLFEPLTRNHLQAYASLVHYGDPSTVAQMALSAAHQGYQSVKLHETTPEAILAARKALGSEVELTVDANCDWNRSEAQSFLEAVEDANIAWLEEPLFPPEDYESLATLANETSVPLAAGENACTRYEFRKILDSRAVTYPQPSVTKVGGVTEFLAIIQEAEEQGTMCLPHSPYYGPGYWATLHLLAVMPGDPQLECLFVQSEAFSGKDTPTPHGGYVDVPSAQGTGFTPNWETFGKYMTASYRITG